MVFEVTVELPVLPGRLWVRTMIPVALPFVVLNVLIVFDVTMDVPTRLPSTWMPVRTPADEKFVIVLDVTVAAAASGEARQPDAGQAAAGAAHPVVADVVLDGPDACVLARSRKSRWWCRSR